MQQPKRWVFEDRDTPVGYKVLEPKTGRIVGWIYRREDALRIADPVPPQPRRPREHLDGRED